ncbi:methyl-accepting chemotaxis protein [Donghicola eburneus]|uniref:methyl-accepting chemotaxis protein n=1 Tax=Donghicola eburneus TaxID=393278 RepID=UPI0008ECF97D|nr:methyl-accepting chemotaxis protein [Donghicola eburneus]SFQ56418.1 methyl-accepting chemotaxis protein [Donghicola eburneus]
MSTANDALVTKDVSAALDLLSYPVMISDADLIIRFVNKAAYEMFGLIEADLRAALPAFDTSDIIGRSIDLFHRAPANQRKMLAGLRKTHSGAFKVGGKALAFKATPQFDENGKTRGFYVEWSDRTEIERAQSQTQALLNGVKTLTEAHAAGQHSKRIELNALEGEYADLAAATNLMLDGHGQIKQSIIETIEAFGQGDFDHPFPSLPGEGGAITTAIERVRGSFRRVISEIDTLSNALVSGDLTRRADASAYEGAYRQIITNFERSFDALNATIYSVKEQVAQVSEAITQVTRSAGSLNDNAQAQAAALEEISATVEQTDNMVRSNAEASKKTVTSVGSTLSIITSGEGRVTEMVTAMEDIQKSSDDISRIIKVIDDIAFQTNLLALNAAVEAARAGTHGRGFAVVAQEVRNLAGRSAKAAKETAELIEDSTSKVNSGVELANDTRSAFTEISTNIQEIESEARRVQDGSMDQARGTQQIAQALGELSIAGSRITNQADELNAAAIQMQGATRNMLDKVEHFSLRPTRSTATAGAAMPDLSQLTPEMMAQIQRMMAAR